MNECDDDPLPCAEAMVAGTLALMMAWASPCPNAAFDACAQRALIARKVVSNLFFLQRHSGLSAGLRQVMANAHAQWLGVTLANDGRPDTGFVPSEEVLH